MRLAMEKAQYVYRNRTAADWVIGGDTTVAVDNYSLGKPDDLQHAERMLATLSGRTHYVFTAVSLVGNSFARCLLSRSEVTFCPLKAKEIEDYCLQTNPLDKAGAYGIQDLGGSFVKHISGNYSGVMGLPLYETRSLLQQAKLV